jgi:NADPH:quinone reductase-like Zn-dependent oxidoreductase
MTVRESRAEREEPTMKAAVLTAYGEVDKLEIREVPDPKAGPNQITIRMAGASINPIDWKLRSGAYHAFMPLELPAILGRDAAGVVVEVGDGVREFKVGARVMGLVNRAYAELVAAASDAWAEVPPSLDIVDAGALPLVVLTGAQLIDEAVKPREGDRVLVIGATGSVGRVAVFVAKARGAKVWAGVLKKRVAEAAKLGADGIVALDDDADLGKLPEMAAIADTVGGDTTQKLFAKLKPGGTIGSVVGEPAGAKARGFAVHAMMTHADPKRLAELGRAVAEGKLVIPIAKKLPLAEVREAQRLAERSPGGKVILVG